MLVFVLVENALVTVLCFLVGVNIGDRCRDDKVEEGVGGVSDCGVEPTVEVVLRVKEPRPLMEDRVGAVEAVEVGVRIGVDCFDLRLRVLTDAGVVNEDGGVFFCLACEVACVAVAGVGVSCAAIATFGVAATVTAAADAVAAVGLGHGWSLATITGEFTGNAFVGFALALVFVDVRPDPFFLASATCAAASISFFEWPRLHAAQVHRPRQPGQLHRFGSPGSNFGGGDSP